MSDTTRKWLCSIVFLSVFAGQCIVLIQMLPLDKVTNESFNVFMLYSMAFAFLPLVLAVGLGAIVLLVIFSVAYMSAGMCWAWTKPR
jgi:hypothetical protein